MISSVAKCFCTVLDCDFILPHCSVMCFSTLFALFYFKLCVYVCPLVSLTPPLYLSLPSVPATAIWATAFVLLCADVFQEKEDKAVLQAEVQSLRQNNQRLQEESQSTVARLIKVTELLCNVNKPC